MHDVCGTSAESVRSVTPYDLRVRVIRRLLAVSLIFGRRCFVRDRPSRGAKFRASTSLIARRPTRGPRARYSNIHPGFHADNHRRQRRLVQAVLTTPLLKQSAAVHRRNDGPSRGLLEPTRSPRLSVLVAGGPYRPRTGTRTSSVSWSRTRIVGCLRCRKVQPPQGIKNLERPDQAGYPVINANPFNLGPGALDVMVRPGLPDQSVTGRRPANT